MNNTHPSPFRHCIFEYLSVNSSSRCRYLTRGGIFPSIKIWHTDSYGNAVVSIDTKEPSRVVTSSTLCGLHYCAMCRANVFVRAWRNDEEKRCKLLNSKYIITKSLSIEQEHVFTRYHHSHLPCVVKLHYTNYSKPKDRVILRTTALSHISNVQQSLNEQNA